MEQLKNNSQEQQINEDKKGFIKAYRTIINFQNSKEFNIISKHLLCELISRYKQNGQGFEFILKDSNIAAYKTVRKYFKLLEKENYISTTTTKTKEYKGEYKRVCLNVQKINETFFSDIQDKTIYEKEQPKQDEIKQAKEPVKQIDVKEVKKEQPIKLDNISIDKEPSGDGYFDTMPSDYFNDVPQPKQIDLESDLDYNDEVVPSIDSYFDSVPSDYFNDVPKQPKQIDNDIIDLENDWLEQIDTELNNSHSAYHKEQPIKLSDATLPKTKSQPIIKEQVKKAKQPNKEQEQKIFGDNEFERYLESSKVISVKEIEDYGYQIKPVHLKRLIDAIYDFSKDISSDKKYNEISFALKNYYKGNWSEIKRIKELINRKVYPMP